MRETNMRQPVLLYTARDVLESEAMGPGLLLQIHEHLLLQFILPIRDGYAVVVPAPSMLDHSRNTAHSSPTGSIMLPARSMSNPYTDNGPADPAKRLLGPPVQEFQISHMISDDLTD